LTGVPWSNLLRPDSEKTVKMGQKSKKTNKGCRLPPGRKKKPSLEIIAIEFLMSFHGCSGPKKRKKEKEKKKKKKTCGGLFVGKDPT